MKRTNINQHVQIAPLGVAAALCLAASGALAHFLTGWALPDSAWSTTVQSGRLICSEGLIDLGLDTPGLREIHGGIDLLKTEEVLKALKGLGT